MNFLTGRGFWWCSLFSPRRTPYKSDGDACRLAWGSKLQILIFFKGVWDGKSLYLPIQVSLKKIIFLVFTKKAMTLTTQKSDEAFYVNIFSATKNSLALIYMSVLVWSP